MGEWLCEQESEITGDVRVSMKNKLRFKVALSIAQARWAGATNYALPTTAYWPPTTHYSVTTTRSPNTYLPRSRSHRRARATDYALLTAHYSLLTTHYSLPTIHYSLLTTHYPLLTIH